MQRRPPPLRRTNTTPAAAMRPSLREHDPRTERLRSTGGFRVSKIFRTIVITALMGAVGCGYTLSATGQLSRHAAERGVVVGAVENRSGEPEAGLIVARLAGRGLAARNVLGRSSDALELRIKVDVLDAVPAGSGGPTTSLGLRQRVPLWRATGRLSMRLVDTSEEPARLIASSTASGNEEYRPGDDVEATEVSRSLALHRLTEALVQKGLDAL